MILFCNHSYFVPLLQILTYRNGCISDKFKERTVKVTEESDDGEGCVELSPEKTEVGYKLIWPYF